jgi:hypothetical protein
MGVVGAAARDDENGLDEGLDLVVVTDQPGTGPRPTCRRIDGVVVDLGVIAADEYLGHARTLTTRWPLVADQYVTTRPTFDPDDWYVALRETHLARLAEAGDGEFVALARESWYTAVRAHHRAGKLASRFQTDAGLVALAAARVAAALVEGLLTRTYFRDEADAVHQTHIAGLSLSELMDQLDAQATELAARDRPVAGAIADLFS